MTPVLFQQHPSSYRDPSGFVFWKDGVLYRQVNKVFKEDFELFISSGFYDKLISEKRLIPHTIIQENFTASKDWYTTLQPEVLPFISFPYEWSFDMLKDAALLTLQLAKDALDFGLMLKDASAYNLQFYKGKMIFIDTLSFEKKEIKKPWIAYRQFCEHFLAPLALMHYTQQPLQELLLAYPEGIPLLTAKKLLPKKSRWNLNVYLHVHLHAKYAAKTNEASIKNLAFNETKHKNILRSLEQAVQSFSLTHKDVWSDYYDEAQQRPDYISQKKEVIEQLISSLNFVKTAVDIGANEGFFSELLASKGIRTISADFDHYSVNQLYKEVKEKSIENIFPVLQNVAQPSPAIGVNNDERASFTSRVKSDLALALALIHHLCIGKNIPFESVATFFRKIGKYLIIEFVPKEDEKIRLMLQQKKDIYDWYTQEAFESAFSKFFQTIEKKELHAAKRTLYLMQAHEG